MVLWCSSVLVRAGSPYHIFFHHSVTRVSQRRRVRLHHTIIKIKKNHRSDNFQPVPHFFLPQRHQGFTEAQGTPTSVWGFMQVGHFSTEAD